MLNRENCTIRKNCIENETIFFNKKLWVSRMRSSSEIHRVSWLRLSGHFDEFHLMIEIDRETHSFFVIYRNMFIFSILSTWLKIPSTRMFTKMATPLPPLGWVLWRRSNRVAISVHCKPLCIWIEVSATVERMYVNNSNCDS